MNREEHERYNQQITFLEKQNRFLLEELSKIDILKPRVFSIDKGNVCLDEIIADENKQLEQQLQVEHDKNTRLNYHAETLQQDLQAEQQAHLLTMETLDQRIIYWHAIEMENFSVKKENLELKQQLKAEQQAHNALREKFKEIHNKLETLRFDGFMHKLASLDLLDEILQAIKEESK